MPDDGTVIACPHCGSAQVTNRTERRRKPSTIDPGKPWVCYDCRTGFDEPDRREPDGPRAEAVRDNIYQGMNDDMKDRIRRLRNAD